MSECRLIGLENNELYYECKECNDESYKSINGLIKKFPNKYQFWKDDIKKFVLLSRKVIYPYEYMDSWKKLNETSLPGKKDFYSEINKEDISGEDNAHAQKFWKVFEIKGQGEYHDLYVQIDTSLLPDMFENFRDKCIDIYELDPVYFLTAPGLAWQACLKKTEVELELLTDNDMLMMVEKGLRGGICQAAYRYSKTNNKNMKNFDKDIESSYLKYLDANNFYGWVLSQKLLVDGFEWTKEDDLSNFNENFIKGYTKNSDEGCS